MPKEVRTPTVTFIGFSVDEYGMILDSDGQRPTARVLQALRELVDVQHKMAVAFNEFQKALGGDSNG